MRGELRSPRLQVLANGEVLPGVLQAKVSSNNHLAADRFQFQVAGGAAALGGIEAPGVRFDVQFSLDGGWASLVQGEADAVVFDPIRGLLDVSGRDLAALMIDSRVDETFANRTSSEIVAVIAGRHGLGVSATATPTLVGRYYQSEHDRLTMGQFNKAMSEWDLLAYLAGREGFNLFMDGNVLCFGPNAVSDPLVVMPEDCLSVQLEHALGMTRAIEVTVRSWDQRGGQAVVQTAQGGGGGRAWKHGIVRPNLPPDEAQRLAARALADLVRHEWAASLTMPGDLAVTPRQEVLLQGTNTVWDRLYSVSEVRRDISVRRGFTQYVSLQGVG